MLKELRQHLLPSLAAHFIYDILKVAILGAIPYIVGVRLLSASWSKAGGWGLIVFGTVWIVMGIIRLLRQESVAPATQALPLAPVFSPEQVREAVIVSLGDELCWAYLDNSPRLYIPLKFRNNMETEVIVDSIRNMEIRTGLNTVLFNAETVFIEAILPAHASDIGAFSRIDLGEVQVETIRSQSDSPIPFKASGKMILRQKERIISKEVNLSLNTKVFSS